MIKFTHNDALRYNILFERYDSLSSNIGIVGDVLKFNSIYRIIKEKARKESPNSLITLNFKNFRVWNDDQEVSYYLIENESDLIGRKFRKFI